MAHKTLIDGTAYEISGGKTLVDGTAYGIAKGRTLVDGTGYDVGFGVDIKKAMSGFTFVKAYAHTKLLAMPISDFDSTKTYYIFYFNNLYSTKYDAYGMSLTKYKNGILTNLCYVDDSNWATKNVTLGISQAENTIYPPFTSSTSSFSAFVFAFDGDDEAMDMFLSQSGVAGGCNAKSDSQYAIKIARSRITTPSIIFAFGNFANSNQTGTSYVRGAISLCHDISGSGDIEDYELLMEHGGLPNRTCLTRQSYNNSDYIYGIPAKVLYYKQTNSNVTNSNVYSGFIFAAPYTE